MDRNILLSSVLGLILCSLTLGQGTSTINGSVTDPSGAVVPSATVTAIEVDTSVARKAVANTDGPYVLSALRPTRYTLSVEAPGFRTLTQMNVVLLVDQTLTINLKLEVGARSDAVTVEAARRRWIRQRIRSARSSSPSSETSFMLDGVPNIQLLSGVNLPFPMHDALQEFSVQTSNYSAEYGQNAGGVVNIVTQVGHERLSRKCIRFRSKQGFQRAELVNVWLDSS